MDTYLDGNRQFNQTHQQNLAELQQLSKQRRPVGYDPEKLKRLMLQKTTVATVKNAPNKIHTGERGGRYYKRTRQDGTTYREYTW